jgi:uncharacterized membrane protein
VVGFLGDSEVALRVLSAVAGAVTVPLTAFLVRALGESTGVGVLSAGLLALNPLHLWYSQEARPYALLLCLGVGSLLCLTRALRTHSFLDLSGFILMTSLTILTHVVGLVFPLAGLLWALGTHRNPQALRVIGAGLAGILILTSPFVYLLIQAVIHAQSTGSTPRQLTGLEIPYTVFTYLGGYSFGPSVREIQDLGPQAALRSHRVQSAVAVVTLVALAAMWLRVRNRDARAVVLLLVLPIVGTWLGAALTGKAYNVRYTLPAVIGFVALIAVSVSRLSRAHRVIAITLVGGLFIWADAQWFYQPRYWKEDSRSAVALLGKQLPPNSVVDVAPGYQAPVLTYYAQRGGESLLFTGIPDTARSIGSPLPAALLLTRLHHVPHWQELVRSLESSSASSPSPVELVGYRAFLIRR